LDFDDIKLHVIHLLLVNQRFEIVYASSDRKIDEFNDYWASHPWLAVPYGHAAAGKISRMIS
jgi:hypothetical protein